MPRRRSSSEIALEDERQLKRQQDFRAAADAVVAGLTAFAEVEKIALFGFAARRSFARFPAFSPIGGASSNCCTNARMWILRYWLSRTGRRHEPGPGVRETVPAALLGGPSSTSVPARTCGGAPRSTLVLHPVRAEETEHFLSIQDRKFDHA